MRGAGWLPAAPKSSPSRKGSGHQQAPLCLDRRASVAASRRLTLPPALLQVQGQAPACGAHPHPHPLPQRLRTRGYLPGCLLSLLLTAQDSTWPVLLSAQLLHTCSPAAPGKVAWFLSPTSSRSRSHGRAAHLGAQLRARARAGQPCWDAGCLTWGCTPGRGRLALHLQLLSQEGAEPISGAAPACSHLLQRGRSQSSCILKGFVSPPEQNCAQARWAVQRWTLRPGPAAVQSTLDAAAALPSHLCRLCWKQLRARGRGTWAPAAFVALSKGEQYNGAPKQTSLGRAIAAPADSRAACSSSGDRGGDAGTAEIPSGSQAGPGSLSRGQGLLRLLVSESLCQQAADKSGV